MSDSLFISAGEFSGDQHGADVAHLLKKSNPSMALFGLGGDALKAAGVSLVEHNNRLAFMGLGEVLRNYFFLKKVMNRALDEVDRRKPKAALLIDYPGFNMRLARALRRRRIKVYYYILQNSGRGIVVALKRCVRPLIRCSSYSPLRLHCFKNRASRQRMWGILWWSRSNACKPHRGNLFHGVREADCVASGKSQARGRTNSARISESCNLSRATNEM